MQIGTHSFEHEEIGTIDRGRTTAVGKDIILPLIAPILQWLTLPEIEEVAINRPGEMWIRLRKPENGRIWIAKRMQDLGPERMKLIVYTLANLSDTPHFGPRGNPVSFGTLPGGHRYCTCVGSNVQYVSGELDPDGTIIFCARQNSPDRQIRMKDYGLVEGRSIGGMDAATQRKFDSADPKTRLMMSIERGDHILVSGATGSGKTTLLNHIISMLHENLRIVSVEDTSELKVPQKNHVHILMNRSGQSNLFTYKSVVDLIVRMTPDVVMAGEISTQNAATIWELMRSGHGHFMTTIHAETAKEAVSTFITRIGHSSPGETTDRPGLALQMREKMRIVQINRMEDGTRRITEVI